MWAFFILMTFCGVDYLMTLEPYWYSTVYGFMIVIGGCLTAMSIVIATLTILARYEPMNHAVSKRHLHDLGKLLLTLTMLWAYLSFSQLLITWSGNLPLEIGWYIKRWNGGWGWIGILVLVGHFVFPFLLLLSQDLKRNPNTIRAIAIYLVLIRAVDVYYLVEPNFTDVQNPINPHFTLSLAGHHRAHRLWRVVAGIVFPEPHRDARCFLWAPRILKRHWVMAEITKKPHGDEHHKPGTLTPKVSFERRDVNVFQITAFGIGLLISCIVVVVFAMWALFAFLAHREDSVNVAMPGTMASLSASTFRPSRGFRASPLRTARFPRIRSIRE